MTAAVSKKNLQSDSFSFAPEAQREARELCKARNLPSKNEEPWRKIDLRPLPMPAFWESAELALQKAESASQMEIELPPGAEVEAALWIGPNLKTESPVSGGQAEPPNPQSLTAGNGHSPKAALQGISEIISGNISLNEVSELEARFEKSGRGYDYFDEGNRAFASRILFLKIKGRPKGAIRLRHHLLSGQSLVHRTYILAEELSEATIIEEFIEAEGGGALRESKKDKAIQNKSSQTTSKAELEKNPNFWLPATLLLCKAGSRVEHVIETDLSENSWHFFRTRYLQERDSHLRSAWLHTGAKSGKDVLVADMLGSGTSFRGLGVKLAGGQEFSDVDVEVCHHASHSQSSLLYKTVLAGRSHSVFTGNLFIEPGTKDIDSHQENHNILLSDTARAESMPDLVIKAEEVSCEHGATVGALDETALFFLMARGLPETEARELLIEAFLASLLEELSFGEPTGKGLVGDALSSLSPEEEAEQTSPGKNEKQRLLAKFRKKLAFGKQKK